MQISNLTALSAMTVTGLLAGWLIAQLSYALPRTKPAAKTRRPALLSVVGAIIGAAAMGWADWRGLGPMAGGFTAILAWQLLLIAIVDAENYWLPDALTLPLGVTGILASGLLPAPLGQGWIMAIVSAVIAFVALWAMALIYKLVRKTKGMGAGDPILLAAGCAWVGIGNVLGLLLVASVGALAALMVQKLRRQSVSMQSRLPFGSYLSLGIMVCWLLR